jgi:uncharacterized membrane protein
MGIFRHGYWSYVIYEKSPFGWYEALLLFLCFVFAGYNLFLVYTAERRVNVPWLILSAGFFYLTLDEKFALHESIRENFFKSNDITLDIFFWTEKGDYVLLLLMAAGLFMLPFILKELKKNAKSFIFFIIAVIFGAAAVLTDSADLSLFSADTQKILQYAEEIFETASSLFFMNSFFVSALKRIQK